jgi:peptidoglycan/xylan/chitin deacetylase (PgdA/CDA1 family)
MRTSLSGSRGSRDFAGYGAEGASVVWPGDARIALNLVLNYEEGAERTPLDGDRQREPLNEGGYSAADGERDLLQESVYEFGGRAGVWRVLRAFDRFGVIATVFASGLALERNPGAAAAFKAHGYDIVGHGYRWIPPSGMGEEEERAMIRRAVESIERTTGQRIVGWYTRPPVTMNTRRILAEEGFVFDSDSLADDLPYYVRVNGRIHLVVPYTLDVNDIRFWRNAFFTAGDWFDYARDCFDVLYSEGGSAPKMMSVGLHARIIGRAGRAAALERFLAHVRLHTDVWICRRTDLARYWLEHYPPDREWQGRAES